MGDRFSPSSPGGIDHGDPRVQVFLPDCVTLRVAKSWENKVEGNLASLAAVREGKARAQSIFGVRDRGRLRASQDAN